VSVLPCVGGIGVIWSIAFAFIVFESPEDHPRITREEVEYIHEAMGPDMPSKGVRFPLYAFLRTLVEAQTPLVQFVVDLN